jgi:hypothetical protein
MNSSRAKDKDFQSEFFDHLAHDGWAENLPLRRDFAVLFAYLAENKVVGTQGTGNFPLKHVRGITEKFVVPPALEEKIGDKVYRVRSEDEVSYLAYLHQMAIALGLIQGGHARRWRVTPEGRGFPDLNPGKQVWIAFCAWWALLDWCAAYPFSGLARGLPKDFRRTTHKLLCDQPVEVNLPFDPFAEKLIAQTGMTWETKVTTIADLILRSAVKAIVIGKLEEFGVIHPDYTRVEKDRHQLSSFRVTRQGSLMLAGLDPRNLPRN